MISRIVDVARPRGKLFPTPSDLLDCSSKRTIAVANPRAWTPDSQGLAFVDPRTRSDIWIQPIDGGAPRQLTRFPADGREIWDFRGLRPAR